MHPMHKALQERGFQVEVNETDKRVTIEARLSHCLRFLQDRRKLPWMESGWKDVVEDDSHQRVEWAGGSLSTLMEGLEGKIDMGPFNKAYQSFSDGKLSRELQHKVQDCIPKRKRRFSEHDGEWNYDRRWEVCAFQATHKVLTPARVVKIIADFSASCQAEGSAIDKYGAMVWAVSQLIEKCGIQTEIVYQNNSNCIDSGRSWSNQNTIELKKPGQYLAPSLLAGCFRSVFFRRFGIGLIEAAANCAGRNAAYGRGKPKEQPHPVQYLKPDTLHLSPNAATGYDNELKDALLRAIKGDAS